MPRQAPPDNSLGSKLIKGSAWMLAMRWLSRFMGLASMVVVARLLTPFDFGVFAVATAFIGLIDALTEIGADIAIIRLPHPEPRHYNTAWTFKVILHSLSALVIMAAAPLAAYLYADDRYIPVLNVLALSLAISGLANIAIADFRRDLQFHKDFKYNVLVQLAGVLTTLSLAYLLRSYWALVLGILARSLAGLALSYAMHRYRPKLSLAARVEMFGFSFWVMVRSIAMFLTGNGDRLILGAFFAPAITGNYAVASTLAYMAIFELVLPISRAVLPGLAAKQGDTDWERRNLKKIFGGTATIAAAAGFGLSALALPTVTLVYGPRFTLAGSMLSVLVLASAISAFNQPASQYLTVQGRVKELAIILLAEGLAALGVAYYFGSRGANIQAVIYARLLVSSMALLRLFYLLRSVEVVDWRDILGAWLRPLIAGLALYGSLWFMQRNTDLSPALTMATGVPLGALVFTTVLFATWHLMKRPPGLEDEILVRLPHRRPRTAG